MAPRSERDALRGSVDLLILKTLSLAPMHGWGISQQQISKGVLEMNRVRSTLRCSASRKTAS